MCRAMKAQGLPADVVLTVVDFWEAPILIGLYAPHRAGYLERLQQEIDVVSVTAAAVVSDSLLSYVLCAQRGFQSSDDAIRSGTYVFEANRILTPWLDTSVDSHVLLSYLPPADVASALLAKVKTLPFMRDCHHKTVCCEQDLRRKLRCSCSHNGIPTLVEDQSLFPEEYPAKAAYLIPSRDILQARGQTFQWAWQICHSSGTATAAEAAASTCSTLSDSLTTYGLQLSFSVTQDAHGTRPRSKASWGIEARLANTASRSSLRQSGISLLRNIAKGGEVR